MKRTFLCIIVISFLLLGCNGKSSPNAPPKTVAVSGKIYSSIGNINSGRIVFKPQNGSNQEAYGTINNDGTYKLTSFNKDDGAMTGLYIVYIENAKSVPRKYLSDKTSDLTISVEESKTDYPINLK